MWKCENVANANVANSQLGIGIGNWQHFHIGNIATKAPYRKRLSRRLQSSQSENGQQSALWQGSIPVMRHWNRASFGVYPDKMAAARAVVPEFGILEDAFDLFVAQGLHLETFLPRPKSMPSVTSTRYWRNSASFPPSVKHSGCPRTSARYLSPSCVTSATKCSPCVSNSMTDGTGRTVSPHGLPRVDTMNTRVFVKASSRLMPYRCNLRSARRARSRSILKVLSSVFMPRIVSYFAPRFKRASSKIALRGPSFPYLVRHSLVDGGFHTSIFSQFHTSTFPKEAA